nr:macro domain-containing protein [Agromyces luteolus]
MAPCGLAASAIYGFARAWPRPIETQYRAPSTIIRLVRGDLLEQPDSHLVIGVSDTFDTASPYIATSSVQGQFLQRVYGNDIAKLDEDIETQLATATPIGTIAGKLGKSVRYPLGTTIALRSNARRYFLVAYTLMDAKSTASTTTDGVWNSLSELWKVVRSESNGGRVCIPMIGGGQSKLSPVLPSVDSVRFIALSFILASRTQKVCDELVIVAPPKQYDALDHLEIQAFLNSLRPSR